MRVIRLRMQRFRGFAKATLLTNGPVALVGEPRAGRTDVITALRRVLEPRSTAARVDPLDVHRPLPPASDDGPPPLTEVEVTLTELGPAIEQLLDARLELIDPGPASRPRVQVQQAPSWVSGCATGFAMTK